MIMSITVRFFVPNVLKSYLISFRETESDVDAVFRGSPGHSPSLLALGNLYYVSHSQIVFSLVSHVL